MYEVLARVYDAALGDQYDPFIRREFEAALGKHFAAAPGMKFLDAGCGTGLLSCRMAKQGWAVTGLDRSVEMLQRARQREEAEGCQVEWLEGDMRSFSRENAFDVVVSFYDSLNHLMTNADLMRALHNFRLSLKDEGLLAFDVNNRLAYWLLWGSPEPFEVEVGESRVRIDTTYDKANRVGEAIVRVAEGGETREERLRQRFFSDSELQGLLMAEGFEVIDTHDFECMPEGYEVPVPDDLEELGSKSGLWRDHDDPQKVKTFWLCRKSKHS